MDLPFVLSRFGFDPDSFAFNSKWFPAVSMLLPFDEGQILMWRGREWKFMPSSEASVNVLDNSGMNNLVLMVPPLFRFFRG